MNTVQEENAQVARNITKLSTLMQMNPDLPVRFIVAHSAIIADHAPYQFCALTEPRINWIHEDCEGGVCCADESIVDEATCFKAIIVPIKDRP